MTVLTVSGALFVRERIAIEPDAVATVKVVDHEGEVLAATAVTASEVPVEFSVAIDPEMVDGDLFVWAFLRNGDAGWGTLELVPADEPEIELNRIGA
ncbi:YbaY family lipoprotein [Aeromicrobium sp. 179-A 4D2 NHS]|uniref:YbaY family lipoprotein n=1 Tax=Aeromicrobium sp. 179-A 4D2 NHS TaxID=3142375 RepID=UPI00399F1E18